MGRWADGRDDGWVEDAWLNGWVSEQEDGG